MKPIAFSTPGQFWRGNLHTHSTRSDGVLEPEEVCRRYKAEGYDFLTISDHFIGKYGYPITDTVPFRTNRFTTILGAELHSGAMENGGLWHILAVGLPDDFTPPNAPDFSPVEGQETGPEIARRCAEAGAFIAIAHPEWSGMSLVDARSIDVAHAVEIYNHSCATGADRPGGLSTIEQLLAEGQRVNLIATDDAHFDEPDHFGGWVMVKAEENAPEALVAALKIGAFYSSQGPTIHDVKIESKTATIKCSPVVAGFVAAHGSKFDSVQGHSMTEIVVPLERVNNSPWIRFSVLDAAGKRAWTNPIWRD